MVKIFIFGLLGKLLKNRPRDARCFRRGGCLEEGEQEKEGRREGDWRRSSRSAGHRYGPGWRLGFSFRPRSLVPAGENPRAGELSLNRRAGERYGKSIPCKLLRTLDVPASHCHAPGRGSEGCRADAAAADLLPPLTLISSRGAGLPC